VADGSIRILFLALQYDSENRVCSAIASMSLGNTGPTVGGNNLQGVFQELQIRLEDTFHFTKEQTVRLFIFSTTGRMSHYIIFSLLFESLHKSLLIRQLELPSNVWVLTLR
jgi:hypothetical protein